MDNTLELFKLFHYLKEVTTKSYSLKKLQDMMEKRLSEGGTIPQGEYDGYVDSYREVYSKLKSSLKEIEELTK
jgi:hypothetical protein